MLGSKCSIQGFSRQQTLGVWSAMHASVSRDKRGGCSSRQVCTSARAGAQQHLHDDAVPTAERARAERLQPVCSASAASASRVMSA